jgi:hypothetical protein
MTNEALVTAAENLPNLTCFRFALYNPRHFLDNIRGQPFHVGFRAIMESFKGLRHISIAARLIDDGLNSVGKHADNFEVLSLSFTSDNDIYRHALHA